MKLDGNIYDLSDDVTELRDGLAGDLVTIYPSATEEQLTYYANMLVGTLFAFPGIKQTDAESKVLVLHQMEVASGNPLAVGLEDSTLSGTYRPIYEQALAIKAKPVDVLRANFPALSLKDARVIVKKLATIIEAEQAADEVVDEAPTETSTEQDGDDGAEQSHPEGVLA